MDAFSARRGRPRAEGRTTLRRSLRGLKNSCAATFLATAMVGVTATGATAHVPSVHGDLVVAGPPGGFVAEVNNSAPVCESAEYPISEDSLLSGVVACFDADGDLLSFAVATSPTRGTLTLDDLGSFSYLPNTDVVGLDSFQVTAFDGEQTSAPATITVAIEAVNDAPVVAQLADQWSVEGDDVAVQLSAADPDSDLLTWSADGLPPTLTIDSHSGLVSGTIGASAAGVYPVSISVSDGIATTTSGLTWTVTRWNRPPVAQSEALDTAEDTAAAIVLTGVDPNGDSLAFTVVSPPSHGSLSGTAPSLVYTPEPNYFGPDVVTFTASDGELSSEPATIDISVTSVNDAPVLARPADQTTIEGADVQVTFGASDIDSEFLTFTASGLPAGLHLDEASGTVTGAPTTVGTSSVTVTVSDGDLSDSTSFTWTVTPRPDTTPPGMPAQLTASVSTTGVQLAWAANPEADLAGYRVYRSTGGAAFVELTSAVQTATGLTDVTAAGQTGLAYHVVAIDRVGNVSAPASVTTVRTVWLRGWSSAANTTLTKAVVVPRPTGTMSGDLLVVVLDARGGVTVTPPSGWAVVRNTVSGGVRQVSMYRIAGATEPASYTFTLGSGRGATAVLLAYGGVLAATPLDANGGATATSRTITAPSITTTATGDLLVAGYGIANSSAITGPSAMSCPAYRALSATNNKAATRACDQIVGAAGVTGTRVATAATSGDNVGHALAFRVQAAAVDTTPPAVPVGLKATAQPDSVQLSWAGSSEPDLAGYRVYRNSGGGSFVELTASPIGTPSFIDAVVPGLVALSYRVTAVDTSGNASGAAFVSVPAAGSSVEDVSAEAGLAMTTRSWAVSTVDYDNDGDDDVHLALHANAESKLMRNNGDGTFTWVAQGTWSARNTEGKQIDRHACAWADVDGNGLKDVYCTVGRNSMNQVKTALVDNEMWLQLTPGQFTDVGTQWRLGDACGRGRYPAFLDVNRDGWPDLFVGNDTPRTVTPDSCDDPANGYPNENAKFFVNLAGHGFRAAPEYDVDVLGAGNSCAVPVDYDKDGWVDLLTCHFVSHRPYLFRNTGSGFVEVGIQNSFLTGFSGAALGDLDGDGYDDLVTSDPTGFVRRPGTPTGFGPAVRFASTPGGTIWAWDVAIADANGDGRPDIYGLVRDDAMLTNPDDMLFVNQGGLSFLTVVPPSSTGDGNAVTAVRRAPTSHPEFLVLNGREQNDGPLQLIRLTGYVP